MLDLQSKFNTLLIIIGGIFIIIAPFINVVQYQFYEYDQVITFQLLSITFGGFQVFGLVLKKEIKFRQIDLLVGVMLIFISIQIAFFKPYLNSINLLTLISFILVYIYARSLSRNQVYILIITISIGGVIQAIYGQLQLMGICIKNHPIGITGSFYNPGPFAGYLTFSWGILLYFSTKKTLKCRLYKSLKNYAEIALFVVTFSIISSGSRSGILSILFIGLPYFAYLNYPKVRVHLTAKKRIFTITVVSLFPLLLGSLFYLYKIKQDSADGRVVIWKNCLEIIKKTPFLGHGIHQFDAVYMLEQANYFSRNSKLSSLADNTRYAFNELLEITIEFGFVGLLASIIFISFIFINLLKNREKNYTICFILAILPILIFSAFSYPFTFKVIVFNLILLIGMTGYYSGISFHLQLNNYLRTIFYTFSLCFLLGSSYVFYLNVQSLEYWGKAKSLYYRGEYQETYDLCQKIYPSLKNEGDFLMLFGKTLIKINKQQEGHELLKQSTNYCNNTVIQIALAESYKSIGDHQKALMHYEMASNMVPSKFLPQFLKAKLLFETGDLDKADHLIELLLNKPVKVKSTAIKEIRYELKKMKKEIVSLANQ